MVAWQCERQTDRQTDCQWHWQLSSLHANMHDVLLADNVSERIDSELGGIAVKWTSCAREARWLGGWVGGHVEWRRLLSTTNYLSPVSHSSPVTHSQWLSHVGRPPFTHTHNAQHSHSIISFSHAHARQTSLFSVIIITMHAWLGQHVLSVQTSHNVSLFVTTAAVNTMLLQTFPLPSISFLTQHGVRETLHLPGPHVWNECWQKHLFSQSGKSALQLPFEPQCSRLWRSLDISRPMSCLTGTHSASEHYLGRAVQIYAPSSSSSFAPVQHVVE